MIRTDDLLVSDIFPNIIDWKHIPRNFPHIKHIRGSKMGNSDTLVSEESEKFFTKNSSGHKIEITEKIDGSNAGVIKKDGMLIPLNKKGYDMRSQLGKFEYLDMIYLSFIGFVLDNASFLLAILDDHERISFESCYIKQSLRYRFKGEKDPVFFLDYYDAAGNSINNSLKMTMINHEFRKPALLNSGVAITPDVILSQYPNGVAGSRDGIEGVVYRCRDEGRLASRCKFVSNQIVTVNGTEEDMPDKYEFNEFKNIPNLVKYYFNHENEYSGVKDFIENIQDMKVGVINGQRCL